MCPTVHTCSERNKQNTYIISVDDNDRKIDLRDFLLSVRFKIIFLSHRRGKKRSLIIFRARNQRNSFPRFYRIKNLKVYTSNSIDPRIPVPRSFRDRSSTVLQFAENGGKKQYNEEIVYTVLAITVRRERNGENARCLGSFSINGT